MRREVPGIVPKNPRTHAHPSTKGFKPDSQTSAVYSPSQSMSAPFIAGPL